VCVWRWEIFSLAEKVSRIRTNVSFVQRVLFPNLIGCAHQQQYMCVFVPGGCVRTSQLAASTPHNTQIGFAEHLVKSEKRAVNFSPGTRRPRELDSRHTMCFCQSITFPCHIHCAAQ
jgi:hypothetical protein